MPGSLPSHRRMSDGRAEVSSSGRISPIPRMAPIPLRPLFSWRPGRLAWNTLHAGGWSAARVVLQAISLILLARVFGAQGYGALSGTVALYTTLAQLVGLGSGIALVRHFARTGESSKRLPATQATYLVTGVVLCLVAILISFWLLTNPRLSLNVLAPLAFAELVIAPALMPMSFHYQAIERLSISGALMTMAPVARCSAVLLAMAARPTSLEIFALLYLGCLAAVALVALLVWWPKGGGVFSWQTVPGEIREGIPYAVTGAAATAGNELDKTMMLRLSSEAATGQYAAASRIMQAAFLPVHALVLAAAPRLFKREHGTSIPLTNFALFAVTLVYAGLAALAFWLVAPWLLPLLLGSDFSPATIVIELLALALVTGSVRQIVVMLLTTSDQQKARNVIEVGAIPASLALMGILIPRYSAAGAAAAVILCDVLVLAMGLRTLVRDDELRHSRRLR